MKWDTKFGLQCNKRLIYSEKHVKSVYISNLKKTARAIFEIFTFGRISDLPYPAFGFSIFATTWKYYLYTCLVLCINFGVSIFIGFWRYQVLNIHHTVTHTCILKDQFLKIKFLNSRDLKICKSGENWRLEILTENNTNCSRK